MRKMILFTIISMSIAVSGCGVVKPGTDKVIKDLQANLTGHPSWITVVEVKKTNGQSLSLFGAKIYRFNYEAKIQINSNIAQAPTLIGYVRNGLNVRDSALGIGCYLDGSVKNIKGTIDYVYKENGWEPTVITGDSSNNQTKAEALINIFKIMNTLPPNDYERINKLVGIKDAIQDSNRLEWGDQSSYLEFLKQINTKSQSK